MDYPPQILLNWVSCLLDQALLSRADDAFCTEMDAKLSRGELLTVNECERLRALYIEKLT